MKSTMINLRRGRIQFGQKIVKNFIFSKVLKPFTHSMACFETVLGMLFHLYNVLCVTYELFEKIEKTAQKLLLLG